MIDQTDIELIRNYIIAAMGCEDLNKIKKQRRGAEYIKKFNELRFSVEDILSQHPDAKNVKDVLENYIDLTHYLG